MRADDEHDPLDGWLSQQVRPLPPPPGTFELITKRARGRKLRKLAVTVASAAAVAAAVAIAVPVGIHLNLSPSQVNGHSDAAGSTPSSTGTGTESPTGKGSQIRQPSPSPSATAQPNPAPSGGLVPGNFQPSSVTFVSQSAAWVIGQAGTPGTCANKNPDICTSIAWTTDDGKTWRGSHAPDTFGPSGAIGVSGIRFLNGSDGWAFGPELWSTTDGGGHWTQFNTGGARVTDLEASDGRAYALFATCAGTSSAGFAADCTSYTLMTTTAGSDDWQAVGGATNGLTDGGSATSAVLALTGSNGYLLAPDGTLYSGPIGGTWSRTGTSNCQPGRAQANGLPSAALLALQNSANVDIACTGTAATAPADVYSSTADGANFSQQPAAVWSGLSGAGTMTSFSVAPDGALVMATTTGIYYYNPLDAASRWQASSATGSKAPTGGFSYVGMTTDDQGVALPADTSLHEIWMTSDGGQTWSPIVIENPGS